MSENNIDYQINPTVHKCEFYVSDTLRINHIPESCFPDIDSALNEYKEKHNIEYFSNIELGLLKPLTIDLNSEKNICSVGVCLMVDGKEDILCEIKYIRTYKMGCVIKEELFKYVSYYMIRDYIRFLKLNYS